MSSKTSRICVNGFFPSYDCWANTRSQGFTRRRRSHADSSAQRPGDQTRGVVSATVTPSRTVTDSSPNLPSGTKVHASSGASHATPRFSSKSVITAKATGAANSRSGTRGSRPCRAA